jgi:hypothetical protein
MFLCEIFLFAGQLTSFLLRWEMEIAKPIKYLCFGEFFLYCGNHCERKFSHNVFSREIFRISLVVELGL